MENSTSADLPSALETFVVSGIICTLCVFGLVTYCTVLLTILKNPSVFQNSFYSYLVSLGVSDILILCTYLFYCAPIVVVQDYALGDFFDALMGDCINLGWFSALPTIAIITINRYWGVCRSESVGDVFSIRNARIHIAIIWFVSLAVTIYEHKYIRLYYDLFCFAFDYTLENVDVMIKVEQVFAAFACLSIVFAYILIAVEMRRQNAEIRNALNQSELMIRKRLEIKLALQFVAIGVFLIVLEIVFTVLPAYTLYRWHLFIITFLHVVNCSFNPFIYILTSSQIREHLLICGSGGSEAQVAPLFVASNQNANSRSVAMGPSNIIQDL